MTETKEETHHPRPARGLMLWTAAAVLLVNLLIIALGLLSLAQSREKCLSNARTQSQNLTHMLDHSITGLVDTADIALLGVVDEAQRQFAQGGIEAGSINAFISRQHARLPVLDSVRFADAGGRIAYGTGVVPGTGKSVAERDYFVALRDNPKAGLVISKPVLGLISGKWVIILARRVDGPAGSFAGVVYCAIELEKIRSMLSSIDVGARGRISLRDSAFGVVVRHPESKESPARIGQRPVSTDMLTRLESGVQSDTFFTAKTSDGTPRLISYRKLERYPLYISVGLSPDDYMTDWRADLMGTSALVFLFVLVTLFLSRVIYQKWKRQQEAEAELQSAKDQLELRVSERTEALFRANEQLKGELSERERAEEKLRQGRNMLAQIIDTIPQFVFWKDLDSIYQGCNSAFAKAAGVDHPDRIQGKSDYDLPWLQEESEAYRNDDSFVMMENSPKYHIIEQQLQAGGARCWVDTTKVPLRNDQGEVVGILGVYDDISERKLMEESRDKALALVESLLASTPTGILVYDVESGGCVKANQAIAEMAGATIEQLLAQNFRDIGSWREAGLDCLAEQVLADGRTRNAVFSVASTFGKRIEADCYLSRFEVEGHPHLMFVALDVAEKQRLEQEKRVMEAQMLHVQKLESLGVLAGGIAHDFNNILMVVLGNADLALMRLPADAPERENLLHIEQAATRAADLAQQMLSYSGKGHFTIENLDLTKIVHGMAQMIEVSISKKALLKYDFAPGLPATSGDATQLRQVILNLVLNASEAIGDESGVIEIRTSCMDCDRAYLSESWIDDRLPEGPYLVLEVSDTGCGIDRDIIPKIFDPFFTTKFTGRGLGMAAVLGIVRSHRGAIKIYSEKGKGSTFRLLLPCIPGAVALQEPVPVEELWHGSGTVLLVDDEESIRYLGQEMLETLGFSVVVACDGREALEKFQEKREEIVCVLLDLTMPEMDGEATFHALRAIDPEVRVVMSSGYNEKEVSRKFAGAPRCGFIQKPYKVSDMSRKLEEVTR